jgi:hypothetical protein
MKNIIILFFVCIAFSHALVYSTCPAGTTKTGSGLPVTYTCDCSSTVYLGICWTCPYYFFFNIPTYNCLTEATSKSCGSCSQGGGCGVPGYCPGCTEGLGCTPSTPEAAIPYATSFPPQCTSPLFLDPTQNYCI